MAPQHGSIPLLLPEVDLKITDDQRKVKIKKSPYIYKMVQGWVGHLKRSEVNSIKIMENLLQNPLVVTLGEQFQQDFQSSISFFQ